MSELKKNDLRTLTVEGYTEEGLGVGRADGWVVFVRGGVRGERCEVRILKVLKHAAFARVERVESPSPFRREPDCPYYGRCGGCDFRHLTYDEELFAKKQRVEDALRRLGGSEAAVEEILGAPETAHYRNKAQYPVSKDGYIGFYRARTHEVIPVDRCLLTAPEADAAAAAVRRWMAEHGVSGYDEQTGRGLLRHVYVRTNAEGEALVCLLANGEKLPAEAALTEAIRRACPTAAGVLLGVNRRRDNVILAERYRVLWGRDWLEDTLCGLTFRLSVPSFYQVNRAQAERLYEKALEFAALTGRETVLDLYCGVGTITLVMARAAGRVLGAEIVPEAILDARENARRNGRGNAEFFCADASAAAARLAAEGLRPDVVTVDPPRKGLAEDVIAAIAAMEPARVVYVSCDPGTLGRDVARFAAHGYGVRRAAAVDLFPGTCHVETVVLMSRAKE